MKKKDHQNQAYVSQDDSMYAALSVLAQENGTQGDCPEPEDLAAFADGRLRGSNREHIMAHLNDCAECRRHWLMVETAKEEMPSALNTQIAQIGWIAKLLKRVREIKPKRLWAGGGLGLALAACLLLVFVFPFQSGPHQMMVQSYGTLPSGAVARYNAFAGRGADEEMNPSAFMQAYLTGKRDGRDRIQKNVALTPKTYSDETQNVLYPLGQWVVLLQCACIAPIPATDSFWHDQAAIGLRLEKQLHAASQSSALAAQLLPLMTQIQGAVDAMPESGGTVIVCEELSAAIESIENRL